uniref:Cyclic nucleotide-binding domain-containing protein n=1 Tax=Amphiprion ocellaris TaxID=80972 RepID=A0A3Q1CIL3_AMPOC
MYKTESISEHQFKMSDLQEQLKVDEPRGHSEVTHFFIISHRSYYIMCMMAITFLNLIGIPMEIAFLDGHSGLAWEGFNVFSDTLFLIDVALNFRMGIITEDEAILDIKRIRVSYLRTWFIPDVIAAFPIGYILLFAVIMNRLLRQQKMMRILMFVRILSLIRLARVSRLVRFFNEVSNANLEVVRLFFRILSLFMMIFLLCHWNGCIQYFVPMLEEFPSDCWVHYVEMWIVMVSMVSGCLMYTVLVANATAMIVNVDPHLVLHSIIMKTAADIKSNCLTVFVFQQILMVMCSRLLRNVPIFQNRDENFISVVLQKLEYEVYQEGDVIVRQHVPGDRMFFIDHGQVLVEVDSYERELCDGDFFGGGSDLLRITAYFLLTLTSLFLKLRHFKS